MKEKIDDVTENLWGFVLGISLAAVSLAGPIYGFHRGFINSSNTETIQNIQVLERKYECGNNYLDPHFSFVLQERTIPPNGSGYLKCFELEPFATPKNTFSSKRDVFNEDSFSSGCDRMQKFYWKEGGK
jgi:hypothetical protein